MSKPGTMQTPLGNITFVPYGDNMDPHVFPIAKRFKSTSCDSVVVQLASPHHGQVLKIFAVGKDDSAAAFTLTLLQKPLCDNFPKLYYWSRIQSADILGIVANNDNMYAFRQQLGAPMRRVFSMLSKPSQLRLLVFQLMLPLIKMHEVGLLHADVKMENYVNAIPGYDPNWSQQTQVKLGHHTYKVPYADGGLNVKPLLIDFELTIPSHSSQLSSHLVASLHTRPPELLFVGPKGPLVYNERSEAYSLAMAVVYELRVQKYEIPLGEEISPEYVEDAMACLVSLVNCIGTKSLSLAYGHDKIQAIAEFAWFAVYTVGYPGDEEMEKTPLGRVVKSHKNSIINHPGYNFLQNVPKRCYSVLGDEGVAMLQRALRWKNSERDTLGQLIEHPYFKPMRRR
jgi:serine/threonine protein kinase